MDAGSEVESRYRDCCWVVDVDVVDVLVELRTM